MAFNVAVSGLNAASADLAVVGNNVANVATTGFKGSRAEFTDVFAASTLGASDTDTGGGVRLASVSQQFTQGNIAFTQNNLDIAINGQGFFMVSEGGGLEYSRSGQFRVDADGFVVNAAGQRLQGLQADDTGTITGQVGDVFIDRTNADPQETSLVDARLNLDANQEIPPLPFSATPVAFGDPPPSSQTFNSSTSMTVFDTLGNGHELSLYFAKTAPGQWDVHGLIDGETVGSSPLGTVSFGPDGAVDPATSALTVAGWSPLASDGTPNGASTQDFTIEFGNSTQFGSPFAVVSLQQDGFTTGRLIGLSVDQAGVVQGRFTNGGVRALGQVVLANFANPQGLQPLGDANWAETFDSGVPLVGEPGTASRGVLQSGAIEESNVELTAELTKLIIAQRNFQANAQTIRTADTVTQTIINLR